MRRALKKLTAANEKYFGIDVVSIKSQVSEMVKSSTIREFYNLEIVTWCGLPFLQ